MEKSPLVRLVRAFPAAERREIHKFLRSPFFNQRQDLTDLYEYIVRTEAPDKQEAWAQVYGEATKYDDQKMRLLMSYLHRLLEQYILIAEIQADDAEQHLRLAEALRRRKLNAAFARSAKETRQFLQERPLRDAAHYAGLYRLGWEQFQLEYTEKPTEIKQLQHLSEWADVSYYIHKLRIICLQTAHQAVYPSADFEPVVSPGLIAAAEALETPERPALQVYLACYRMLREPANAAYFSAFKRLLLSWAPCFSLSETHGLYIWALNYCVRRLNAGETEYFREALDIYQEGLRLGFLLSDGVLSRFTYHNIVAAGIHVGALDWVRTFINEYKNKLEKQYREQAFSFNLARLEYAGKRYDFVLELLQKANYRDPLLNLAAKTLLLKTFYETGAFELLQSHLDAMRNYIHRKRVIGYHRRNYLNIIRFTEKIMQLPPRNRNAARTLLEQVRQEAVLTEKAFFEQILAGKL